MSGRPTLGRIADPTPADRRWLVGFALAALIAVSVLRWTVTDPLIPATTPYFLVVVAGALAYGFRGGAVSSFAVAGLYTWWSATKGPDLPAGQIALRVGALIVPWLAFSWVVGLFIRTSRERLSGVAELERMHTDLEQRAGELEEQTASLEHSNRELERSNRDLEQFARIASHDLSEPLRVVTGFAQLVEQRVGPRLDDQERGFLTAMTGATARMQNLIEDILAWSTAGSAPLTPSEVDVGALVDEVRGSLAAALSESGGTIEADELPTLRADPRQLRQVFQNLLANALKFRGEAAPRIAVRAVPVPQGWRFHVSDNGIGIDPSQAERIFGMFERLQVRGDYPGTGIGLSICQTVVERHGGEIWVEPTPGGGTTFCFTLGTLAPAGDEVPPLPDRAAVARPAP